MTNETRAPSETRAKLRAPIKEGPVKLHKGEYRGRNGEILRRVPNTTANPFDIPGDVKEPGWSYQFVRHSVYGNTDYSEMSVMKRAGWREVSPDALNGYFREETPEGQNFILKEGLCLMERPQGMTDEARDEALRTANDQYARQLDKRYDADAPLPTGFVPHLREIRTERYQPAPQEWQPKYNPRATPIADDE